MAASEEIGGVKVSITGDYSSLPAAFDAASLLARNFAGRFTQIIGTAGPAFDSLGNSFIKTGSAMTIGVTAPIVALGAAMASGIDDFRKFELSMRQVTSLMGNVSQAEFKKLSDATLELSTRLGVDAVNAAKGLYEAISAGVPKENAISFLEVASKTAIAGVTNTKVAVDGLTTVLNTFRLSTGKTKEVADAMFMAVNIGKITFEQLAASMAKTMPIAAQVGLSYKEILAAAATLTRSGAPVSEAMTQISRAIISILKPSEEMEAVFKKLGVASGKMLFDQRGLHGALAAVREATGGVDSAMLKAMPRFEGYRALIGLTGANAKVAAEDLNAVTNSTGAMDLAFKEIEKSGARGFESLKVAMKNLSIQAAEVLAPAIATVVKNWKPLIEGTIDLIKWFAKLDPAIQQTTGIMLVMVASAGPLALMAGWFLKVREAALVLVPSIMSVTGALNLLAKVPYVALVASFAALIKATYDWKNARDSMHKSEQEERDGLAKLEISLRQAGINIAELSNQYNHGLISHREYLKGLQALAIEHGNTIPKVKSLTDGLKDLGNVPPPVKIAGAIKGIGTEAKEAKNSIDEFMDSWNRQFAAAVPTTEDLAQAVRDVARQAYEAISVLSELPPLLDSAAGATDALAASAEASARAMKDIVPPELPAKIEDVTKKTETWGNVTETTASRSKESIREIRRAIESISGAMAKSIVDWKGWGEAAKNVLKAVVEAILKTVITRILEATGLVDKLMDGITSVLSKIGINAATSAASGAASSGGSLAASAAMGGGGGGGGGSAASLGSLSNVLGIAGLGVSVASGIVQGIQNARMEADIAKIEISTRQVKEQLVGGVQPRLDTYLPKLDYLLDIWKELIRGNDKMIPAILQNTQALANLLEDGGKGLGGGYFGSQGSPGGGTWAEIMAMLKILTQPTSGGTTGEPISVGGATEPIMSGDTARKLSRGFDVLANFSRSGTGVGAGFIPASLQATYERLFAESAESAYLSYRDMGKSLEQLYAERLASFDQRLETFRRDELARGVPLTGTGQNYAKQVADWLGVNLKQAQEILDAEYAQRVKTETTSQRENRLDREANAGTAEQRLHLELQRKVNLGLMSELEMFNQETALRLRTIDIMQSPENQRAAMEATRLADAQRNLIPTINEYNLAQRELTVQTYALIQQSGGHSAVDIGNQSFINIGGAATGGSTRAGMSAELQAQLVQQYAQMLQQEIATRERQAAIADAQLNTWKDAETYVRQLIAAGNSLATINAFFRGRQAEITKQFDEGKISYEEFGRQSNALLPGFAMSSPNITYGGTRQYAAAPINSSALLASYSAQLGGNYRDVSPFGGSNMVPMGGNSRTPGSVPITIYATDSSARSIGNGLIQVLQQNGIYR